MILDKLDEINIKDLSIKEPTFNQAIPFNPRLDITSEDWEKIKIAVHYVSQFDASRITLDEFVGDIALVFPDRGADLDPWGGLTKALHSDVMHHIANKDAWNFTKAAVGFRILYPDFPFDYWEQGWKLTREGILKVKNKQAVLFFRMATKARMIFPEREPDYIQEGDLDKLLEEIANDSNVYQKKAQDMLLPLQATGRILFPSSNKFGIAKQDWKEIVPLVSEYQQDGDWINYMHLAATLTPLIAQKIKITDKGVQFIMPGDKEGFIQKEEPLPLRRNF